MASNDATLADEDGEFEDWIELHNTGSAAVDLRNWYLTDDSGALTKWQLPSVSLAAGDYLVVFASGKDRALPGSELHTNFSLRAGGEYLGLVQADGTSIADEVAPEYPEQFTDVSFGAGQYFSLPTPGAANGAGFAGLLEPVSFSVPHGYFDAPQTLTLTNANPAATILYTTDGSEPVGDVACTPPADGSAWRYDYYHGSWVSVPDFDSLTPVASGTTNQADLSLRQRDTNYGFRFQACVQAAVAGNYTFDTTSADGSLLRVDGALVVDNDGLHGPQQASGTLFLEAGLHAVELSMFQASGSSALAVGWTAPHRGNAYQTTANLGSLYGADASSPNRVDFAFDLTTSGNFEFSAMVAAPSSSSDSFWVQLDDGPLWLFDTGVTTSFESVPVTDRTLGAISVPLTAGPHVLRFFVREDGAQIDSITVSGVDCAGACASEVLQAESQAASGLFQLSGLVNEPLMPYRARTYSGPITIAETSVVRAIALQPGYLPSATATQTYLFLDDVIQQSRAEEPPAGWPSGPVNTQVLDYGMDPEIVDPDPQAVKDSLRSLPAISIVTDTDNLMHPNIGIYVNARNSGRDWERPGSLELIDPAGAEPGFTIAAGFRMRGGFSRSPRNPKHAFRAFFRSSYGGSLDYPLFGSDGAQEFQKIDFRAPQNYSWSFGGDTRNTLMREVFGRDTQAAMGWDHTRSRYYHLFINGVYWGVSMSQERVSKEYAASYFGGDEADYDVVKHDRGNGYQFDATDGTNAAWVSLFDLVADQTVSAAEYTQLAEQVDLDSLIDYFLINAYEGDTDGSPSLFLGGTRGNNWYAIRSRTGIDSSAAKWQFFQHDGEHSLGSRRLPALEENLTGPFPPFDGASNVYFNAAYLHPAFLHGALESNADYRQRFIDRAAQRFADGGVLSEAAVRARWDAREAQVRGAILAQSARWGDARRAIPLTVADWQAEVNFVETEFFPTRTGIVVDQLIARGLASALPLPQLSAPDGALLTPGSAVDVVNNSGADLYYTLDGSDPRVSGGGVSSTAVLLVPGQSIVINANAQLRLRVRAAGEWSALVAADYTVNAVPTLAAIDDQYASVEVPVGLAPVASDDGPLLWSATGLPPGIVIDSNTGRMTGSATQSGAYAVTVGVSDSVYTVEQSFLWQIYARSPVVLNEFNAVSGSRYLGGGDGTSLTPADTQLGRIPGNGGDWFELIVTEDHLDMRNWQLSISDDGVVDAVLTIADDVVFSNLRAGTVLVVSESAITAADGTVYGEDTYYHPSAGDWTMNLVAGAAGTGAFISASNFRVSNANWQLTISDAAGQQKFGPAGEGAANFSGVGSTEVGKLEQDPSDQVHPGSNYNDGDSSTWGLPNRYAGGTFEQNLVPLRPLTGLEDADQDGLNNSADPDDDNDGVDDGQDPFPLDPTRPNGGPDALFCGEPVFDAAVDQAVFIWRDCTTNLWTLRAVGGSPTGRVDVSGEILAPGGVTNLTLFSIETSDLVYRPTAATLAYELVLWGPRIDGFSFASAAGACFIPKLPTGLPVLLGGNRAVLTTASIDLTTGASCADSDGDRLLDVQELELGTNPNLADTDGGGVGDGEEVVVGTDPLNPADDQLDATACGPVNFDPGSEPGFYLWRDCSAGGPEPLWNMRAVGGGLGYGRYVGELSTPSTPLVAQPAGIEPADVLDSVPGNQSIDFSLLVGGAGVDGFSTRTPMTAETCLTLTAQPSAAPILLGAQRQVMPNSFSLTTLASCGGGPLPAQCGEPSFDPATEPGVYLWQDCEITAARAWNLRVASGGGTWREFTGALSATSPLAAAPFDIEGSDRLDTTPGDNLIDFGLFVVGPGQDGFGFTLDASDSSCLTPGQLPNGAEVFIGRERAPIAGPFNLENLGLCQ